MRIGNMFQAKIPKLDFNADSFGDHIIPSNFMGFKKQKMHDGDQIANRYNEETCLFQLAPELQHIGI